MKSSNSLPLVSRVEDRPELEFALPESQRTLATLLSNLPGMVYRCRNDMDWTMEFVSEGCYDLTGYLPEELILNQQVSYASLIHPEDRSQVWDNVQAAVHKHQPFELVYRINTHSQGEKWVRELGRGLEDIFGNVIALEGFITDISDRKLAEKKIQRQVSRFHALRKIDMAITASFDLHLTLNILLEEITTQLDVHAADILLFNPLTQMLEFAAGRGFRTPVLRQTRLRLGEGNAGKAALTRQTVHIPDLGQTPGELRQVPHFTEEAFKTYFGVPLIAKGQVKGILEIFHRDMLQVETDWLDFMEALAGQAAIAVDNATLFNDLQRSNIELSIAYDATLEGWSKALELRDRETEGHTQRVIEMTVRLAEVIGVEPEQLQALRYGALLHDIGKLAIPDAILLKPGPLTLGEWEIMRQHPVYAYELLSPIVALRPALDIPYCHHERWDGAGYPRGLKGEEIPLAARIFAVADVWDALTSNRPYRPAWTHAEAREYIHLQAGRHFDPRVVEAFLRLS